MASDSHTIIGRVARNAVVLFTSKAAAAVLGLFYLAMAGRSLGASQLGALILIHSTAVAFREIASFKSWQPLIRYGATYLMTDDRDRFHSLLRLTLALDVGGAVVGSLSSAAFVFFFAPLLGIPEDITRLGVIYCLSTLFALKSTPQGILRLFRCFDLLARQALVVPILRSIGVIGCWALELPLTAYVAVWFIADIGAAFALIGLGWKVLNKHTIASDISWRWRKADVKDHDRIWPFIWSANLNATLAIANSHLPVMLSGALLGPAASALVKVCQEVAAMVQKPGGLLAETIYPEVSALASSKDTTTIKRLIAKSLLMGGSVAIVLVSLVGGGGDWLLGTLFGEEFRIAHGLLILLTIAAGIQVATFMFEPLFYALGRPAFILVLRSCASAIQVFWIVATLPRIGVEGVGQAALVGSLIVTTTMALRALVEAKR